MRVDVYFLTGVLTRNGNGIEEGFGGGGERNGSIFLTL